MRQLVNPLAYGRGICLPRKPKGKCAADDEQEMSPTTSKETTIKELRTITNDKPANESLIKKLNGVKRVKRKISFIP